MIEEAILFFMQTIGGQPIGPQVYGWHQKSIGQAILMADERIFWAQIARHGSSERAQLFRGRLKSKDAIPGLRAPRVMQIMSEDNDENSSCLMSFIASPTLSKTPQIYGIPPLSENFWERLKTQLKEITPAESPYISCRQELITRRIHERYGAHLPTKIHAWGSIHGDLHWGNITEDATLLDWESWGNGPVCLDAAFLYGYSVCVPTMTAILEKTFPFLFQASDGLICLLFVCAELLRMIEIYGDHPEMDKPLEALALRVMTLLEIL